MSKELGAKYSSEERPTFRIWDHEKEAWYKPTYRASEGELEELLLSPNGHLNMRTLSGMVHESVFLDRFSIVLDTPQEIKEKETLKNEFELCLYNQHERKYAKKLKGYECVELTEDPRYAVVRIVDEETLYRFQENYLHRPWWKVQSKAVQAAEENSNSDRIPVVMNYELFKRNVNDLGFKLDEDLYFPQTSEKELRVWDCKEREKLATISKERAYEFDITMAGEHWNNRKKADEFIKLVFALSQTDPDQRGWQDF